jgi:hypothetical protein
VVLYQTKTLSFLFLVVKVYLGEFGANLGGNIAVGIFEMISPNKMLGLLDLIIQNKKE